MSDWSPTSWRSFPALQQPVYPRGAALDAVLDTLRQLPPLVTSWEVDALKTQLARAAAGRAFLLQGGDCAERFEDCRTSILTNKLKVLLQMSLVLVQGSKRPVIRVGRFAGQYAKPRSEDFESRQGVSLPSYRGDLVNDPAFTPAAREPNAERLLKGYERSAITLNFIRALVKGGFADLRHPEYWDLGFATHSPLASEYRQMVRSIGEALRFMENVLGVHAAEIERVDFFSSHEGLHLEYEAALTRRAQHGEGWYNLGTHYPWIGMRTADPGGAHVEYFRGIANPIGVKIGPATTVETLARLLDILDPGGEPGRLTLIHRFGSDRIAACLPGLIRAARASGKPVLWCCDPMHGNTRLTASGVKTRRFGDILDELEQAFDIHAAEGGSLSGVHFELSGENVTECLGGARNLAESDLARDYRSEIDPRLNCEQAIEMAMLIARKMASLARS